MPAPRSGYCTFPTTLMLPKINRIATSALIFASNSAWASVVITGDPTTTSGLNLTRIGNSQDPSIKADNSSSGFNYDLYIGRYTVTAGDTVMGTKIVGNTGQGATGGAFSAGSEVLMIGWKATTPTVGGSDRAISDGFLKFDANLNGGYRPASDPGGLSTSFSNSDPGDFQLQTSRNGSEFRVSSFRFYESATNPSTYPLQSGVAAGGTFTVPLADLAFRSFGVNAAASGRPLELSSQLFLLNITTLNSQSFGGTDVNDFGSTLNFYMQQGNGQGKTGIVVTNLAIPEPSAAILVGLSLLALLRRKRS